MKALLWGLGTPRTGHMLPKLLDNLKSVGVEPPRDIVEVCMRLNKLYTHTRCPDVWPEGIPEEFYLRGTRWLRRLWRGG
ncbi:MAG: HEPN domain-containing protein [Crenarchaeota archaeon]|nr:HEPN domain-containing protein [Thermoproteota archaeon]